MKTKAVFMALFAIVTLSLTGSHAAGATSAKSAQKSDTSTKNETKEEAKETVYKVKLGDTLDEIAKKHNLTYPQLFNANESIINPDMIDVGQKIRIPKKDEKLPQRFAAFSQEHAAPAPVAQQYASYANQGAAAPAIVQQHSVTAGNTYAWGNCTWYVKNKRPDMPNMLGNGGQWAGSASARGYATGATPRVGAVAEQAGHVAYVEAVNGNMVTISEMNYAGGLGQVHTRTVPASTFYYIY